MANAKLRRFLKGNQSCEAKDTAVGDSAILNKQVSRESNPNWHGPATILDIDETGATAKSQSRSFKIARYRIRKQLATSPDTPVGGKNAEELVHGGKYVDGPLDVEAPPRPCCTDTKVTAGAQVGGRYRKARTCGGGSRCAARSLAWRRISTSATGLPHLAPAPAGAKRDEPKSAHFYVDMSYKELRDLRKPRGHAKKNAKSLLQATALALGQLDRKRARDETAGGSAAAKKRPLIPAMQPASVAGEEVVKQ